MVGFHFYWLLFSFFQKVYSSWGVQPFGVSGPHEEEELSSSLMGHTLNTLQHVITKKSHRVLSEFMILCRAA